MSQHISMFELIQSLFVELHVLETLEGTEAWSKQHGKTLDVWTEIGHCARASKAERVPFYKVQDDAMDDLRESFKSHYGQLHTQYCTFV